MKTKKRPYKGKAKGKKVKYRKLQVHREGSGQQSALGGLSLFCQLARLLKFARCVDQRVEVLKIHQGYRESDHLYHLLNSLLAGASCIEDLGRLQEDPFYKELCGVDKVSDPTTMGDFLRRFERSDLDDLHEAIWQMRERAWQLGKGKLPKQATLDLDSVIKPVYGNCKEGADFTFKKSFGYHPEMLSLAETAEWLDGINRPGNETSGECAAELLRRNLGRVCGHFERVCVRGDTKFGRTDVLKECISHQVQVCLLWSAYPKVVNIAEELPETAWQALERDGNRNRSGKKRRKRSNLRRAKARQRGYRDKKLKHEQVAEFAYQPTYKKKRMDKTYRMVVIRKQIEVAEQTELFDQYKYHFILTDLTEPSLEKIVKYAYGRNNQENLIEQSKNGLSAFRMPTGELLANEVWMVMALLAQSFKSWLCLLSLGIEKLSWEWKRFRWHYVYLVARMTRSSRQRHLWFNVSERPYSMLLRGMIELGAGGG